MNADARGIPYPLPTLAPADAQAIYQRYSAVVAQDAIAPDVLVSECTETVFNRPATMRDMRRRLRALPLRETLQLLGTIGVEIARGRRPLDAVLQVRVALRLADGSRRARSLVRRLIETPGRVLVDEEQIGVLSALAIEYCEAAQWTDTSGMELLEALLAFNSVKAAELHGDDADNYAALRHTELRATSVDPEKATDITRRWSAFMDWSRSAAARASPNAIDLDALCADALGMSYIEWVTSAWTFTILFGLIQTAPDGSRRYDPFIDADATIRCFAQQEQITRFFAATSVDVDAARAALAAVSTTSLSELEMFMERPLVVTAFGTCCPVPRFLPALAGNALIFRLGAFLDAHGHDSGRLRSLWGEFLEQYVLDQLTAACDDRTRLFPEQKYGNPEMKSSDVAVFSGTTAVFVDVTATRFRLRDSVVGLDDAAAEEDLERFIVHKVRDEIARCAADFRSGALRYDGIDPQAIERIYGLAVSPQSVPRMIGIAEALERLLPAIPAGLTDWEFFDLNEIEFLPTGFPGNLDLAGLIAAKRASPFGRRRSLTNYLYYTNRDLFRVPDNGAAGQPAPWYAEIIAQTRAWGLRDAAPQA